MGQVERESETSPGQASADAGISATTIWNTRSKNGIDLYLPDSLLRALESDKDGQIQIREKQISL